MDKLSVAFSSCSCSTVQCTGPLLLPADAAIRRSLPVDEEVWQHMLKHNPVSPSSARMQHWQVAVCSTDLQDPSTDFLANHRWPLVLHPTTLSLPRAAPEGTSCVTSAVHGALHIAACLHHPTICAVAVSEVTAKGQN